jgi:thiol-disulfide isomerase/thioredoxin
VLVALVLALLPSKKIFSSPDPPPATGVAPLTGVWHAALVPTSEYPVYFDVRISAPKGGALSGAIVNGSVETPFSSVSWDGSTLTLAIAAYDMTITATRAGDSLRGTYRRTVVSGVAEVPFEASRTAPPLPPAAKGATLAGSWGVEVGEAPGKIERLTGVFAQAGAALTGTLLSITGDYGALHGWFDGERMMLTVFDGVHVYRYDGELLPDGTLAGEYRSRTSPPVPWRAKRLDAKAAAAFLPGGFEVVRPKDPSAAYAFAFPDSDAKTVSSSDPRFAGKPMVVTFMGTWCPNCADEAPVLADLAARYGSKGVGFVALAFEYTDDVERNRRQVKRFVERFRVTFPVLIAGTTRTARETAAVTPLEGFEGYPTTLFLDRAHRIVKIHSGFDGPATGERHAKVKREFEEAVKALLR